VWGVLSPRLERAMLYSLGVVAVLAWLVWPTLFCRRAARAASRRRVALDRAAPDPGAAILGLALVADPAVIGVGRTGVLR
jgi:hypothetical protein